VFKVLKQSYVIAPRKGELNGPPAGKEQKKSSNPDLVTPKTEQSQAVAPNKERMNTPQNRKVVSPLLAQGGQREGITTQGQTSPHGSSVITPPAQGQGMNKPPMQGTTRPPAQRRELGD